jgi:hypothetical protein
MKNKQTRKEPCPSSNWCSTPKRAPIEGEGEPHQQAEHLKDEKKVLTWGIYGNRHL